uniref:Uncharacterized protein n=1 Tax=Anopheles arabiensis TaxID=7173 RepID=A0A182IHT9_ANOAR
MAPRMSPLLARATINVRCCKRNCWRLLVQSRRDGGCAGYGIVIRDGR